MRKAFWIAALMGLSMVPAALAQTTASQPAEAATAPAAAEAVVPADQQPTKEQLGKLFEVMRLRQQFESMTRMMPAIVQQQVHQQVTEMTAVMPGAKQLTPEQQAALDKLTAKYMEKAMNLYPADEMIADAMVVYQRHLSRSDVDAYIAFYSSPPGQHLLDAQPVIMKEYMPVVMDRVHTRTKVLYEEMAKDLEDFTKAQSPAPAPAK
jgi:uncharacterized protein